MLPKNHLEIPESTQCLSEKFRGKVVSTFRFHDTIHIIFFSAKLKASYRFNSLDVNFLLCTVLNPSRFIFTNIALS